MAAIRFGSPADIPLLVGYWKAMLEECGLVGSGLVADWETRLTEQFRREMEAGSGTWFIAEVDGVLAGTCTIFRMIGRSSILLDSTGMLAGMYVAPPYRGRGIAHELTRSAIDWCKRNGCTAIRLQASAAGRPIYEAFGFTPAIEMMRLDLR